MGKLYNRFIRSLLILAGISMLWCSAAPVVRGEIRSNPLLPPPYETQLLEMPALPADLFAANENPDREFRKKYKHWQDLTPAEKKKLRRRMNQYKKMPPKEQKKYKKRSKQWQNLSPEERIQIQKRLDRWHQLSPKEKEAIRRKLNNR